MFEEIINGVFLIGGLCLICIPNGLVGLGVYFGAMHFAPSPAEVPAYCAIGGVIWAIALLLVFFPFCSMPRLSIKLMLGWYIAYGLGFSAGPMAANALHQALGMGAPIFFSWLCCGGLPLILLAVLKPLGIVGFPNRKFKS